MNRNGFQDELFISVLKGCVSEVIEKVFPYVMMMLVGVVLGYAWRAIQG